MDPILRSLLEELRLTGVRWHELARMLPPDQSTVLTHAALELTHVTQQYHPATTAARPLQRT